VLLFHSLPHDRTWRQIFRSDNHKPTLYHLTTVYPWTRTNAKQEQNLSPSFHSSFFPSSSSSSSSSSSEKLQSHSTRSQRSIVRVGVTLRLTVSQSVSRSVSQSLRLGVEPTLGLVTRYYFLSEDICLKVAVLFLRGALSDKRMGLQFAV
jgi:hypothetical protein